MAAHVYQDEAVPYALKVKVLFQSIQLDCTQQTIKTNRSQ